MYEVGQKVLATDENSEFDKGTPGTVIEVDYNDELLPYYVAFLDLNDEDGESCHTWCREKEVEADKEEIE